MRAALSKQLGLSLGLGVVAGFVALPGGWALPPIDTVHDGQVVAGGTYYNSAQGKTTFMNSGSGGLWVKGGTTIRGVEVDAGGNFTNNGGTLHFFAPNSVVRIDGNVDVNAILNSQGAPLGSGGRVFVDSAYLFQNGGIFANGINGGLVQMNVAGLTLGPTARIEAQGFGGAGGIVSINSNGVVDLQRKSRIDTSGQVPEDMDRNVINIEGSIVNVEGVLRADGVRSGNMGSRGGQIRLVASGQTDLSDARQAFIDAGQAYEPTLTPTEQACLLERNQSLSQGQDGNVSIASRSFDNAGHPTGGWLSANGSPGAAAGNNDFSQDTTPRAGDGGTIVLAAQNHVYQGGLASVNGGDGSNGPQATAGGNGGLIAVVANRDIVIQADAGNNAGVFQANGGRGGQVRLASGSVPSEAGSLGGQGGLIAFSYNGQMNNQGGIVAKGGIGAHGAIVGGGSVAQGLAGDGGRGGLVVFSGDENPVGGGQVNVNGGRGGAGMLKDGLGGHAGTIVSVNPATLAITQSASQYDGGASATALGTVRPLTEQTAQDEILTHAENLVLLRRNSDAADRPITLFGSLAFGDNGSLFSPDSKIRSVNDPIGTGDALALVLAKDPSGDYPYRNYVVGSSADNLPVNINAAEQAEWQGINNLASLTVANDGITFFSASPGSLELNAYGGSHASLLATAGVLNGEGGLNLGGYLAGGTLNIASGESIFLNAPISSSVRTGIGVVGFHAGGITLKAVNDIQNFARLGIFTGTPLIGMTHRYQAGNNFINAKRIDSDAGFGSLPTPTHGGVITIQAANIISNLSDAFPDAAITANGKSLQGYGGLVNLKAAGFDIPSNDSIQVSGTVQSGTIMMQTIP